MENNKPKTDRKSNLVSITIGLFVAILSYVFSEAIGAPTSIDAYWYQSAVYDFDVRTVSPHLPGYFLYVMLLRIAETFIGNVQLSAIVLSSVAGGIGSFFLTKAFINKRINHPEILALAISLNPICLNYFGSSENYAFDFLTASGIIYFISKNKIYFSLPFLILMAGIRPGTSILLLPYLIYKCIKYYIEGKNSFEFGFSLLISFIIGLSWIIPMLAESGGLTGYLETYSIYNPTIHPGFVNNIINFLMYAAWWVLPLLVLTRFKDFKINWDIVLAILLPVLFFFSYHYAKGYILLCLPFIAFYLLDNTKIYKGIVSIFVSILIYFAMPSLYPPVELDYSNNTSLCKVEKLKFRTLGPIHQGYQSKIMKSQLQDNYTTLIRHLPESVNTLIFDRSNYITAPEFAYSRPNIKVINILNPKLKLANSFYKNKMRPFSISLKKGYYGIGRAIFVENKLEHISKIIYSVDGLCLYWINESSFNDFLITIEENY
ncbi:MAG: hypothetical protein Kapaf2KO_10490 [Candidatus Kapaibacteriales bacterium]